jgi:hypothetical protein
MRQRLFQLVPLFLYAVFGQCQATLLSHNCDLAIFGVKDTKSFVAFDQELRGALSRRDAVATAFLVLFPLRINSSSGTYSIDNATALESRFDEVFPEEIRNAVLNQKLPDIGCRWQDDAVIYGEGDVWVHKAKYGYGIKTINLPDSPPRPRPGVRKIALVCQTAQDRIVIDTDASDTPRYRSWRKPHPIASDPDMTIASGNTQYEGVGMFAHEVWRFKSGRLTYTIIDVGCCDDHPEGAVGSFGILEGDHFKAQHWCY